MSSKITYDDKVSLTTSPLPRVNKCTADDLNEIKTVVNSNADEINSNSSNIDEIDEYITDSVKGTVLFDNSSGAQNVTLSDNVGNYTYLKIFYGASIGSYYIRDSKELIVTDGCDVSLTALFAHSTSLQINTLGRWHITGTSISKVHETSIRFGSANDYTWEGQTSRILISKVIGYK